MQKKCPRNTRITRKSEEDCGENPSLLPSPVGGLFLAWLLDPKNFFSCDSRVSWATPIALFRLRRVFKPVICGPNQCGRERVAADLRAAATSQTGLKASLTHRRGRDIFLRLIAQQGARGRE